MASIGGISFNLVSSFKGMSLAGSSGSPFLRGGGSGGPRSCSVALPSKPMRFQLTVQMAHKKGAGSTKNGRDSPGQRLGVKIYGDQRAKPGSIIIRQRGTKFHPGNNVGLGKDYTIFSLIDGVVKFEKFGPDKKKISVYPKEVQPENPNSYRVRKREYFRALRQLKKERQARRAGGYVPEPQLVLASNDTDSVPLC